MGYNRPVPSAAMPIKPSFRHFTPAFCPLLGAAQAATTLLDHPAVEVAHQVYQEDAQAGLEGVRIESWYVKGSVEITEDTSFRFQMLQDAISGASPTGATDTATGLPAFVPVTDMRQGILGALSRKIDDHLVALEVSRSIEDDYLSYNFALSDVWDLNQKNTTLTFGLSYTDDAVGDPEGSNQLLKKNYEVFSSISQIIDKNTIVSAGLTLGLNRGYLNDPRKVIERTEHDTVTETVPIYDDSDPPVQIGENTVTRPISWLATYPENRPDSRLRGVLQLNGTHYFEAARGALDLTYRLADDDFGVFSNMIQCEWRQSIGPDWLVTPYVRYYRQSAADFFHPTLDGIPFDPNNQDGTPPNYSSDYRLSELSAFSVGMRVRYQINERLGAFAAYERYAMSPESGVRAPTITYPSADVWTFGLSASF